jgi:hypothetical protein
LRAYVLAVLMLGAATPAFSQESDEELAEKLANPVASLVSVPFQFNYDCCFKPAGSNRILLNIQPVIPFALSSDWNLIVRTIVPIIDQPSSVTGGPTSFGIGDTTQSFFFATTVGGWILAAGPDLLYPTATNRPLGSHKWGAGPTGLILQQRSGWTYGVLANHLWSYGGEGEYPNISSTFLQPFLSYTWPDTTSLTLNMENTYNWTAKQWTVPFNLTTGHLFNLGGQRISLQLGGRLYADRPHDSATWGLRFGFTFLFPK